MRNNHGMSKIGAVFALILTIILLVFAVKLINSQKNKKEDENVMKEENRVVYVDDKHLVINGVVGNSQDLNEIENFEDFYKTRELKTENIINENEFVLEIKKDE